MKHEGLEALYEALQEWILPGDNGQPGTAVQSRGDSGLAVLEGSLPGTGGAQNSINASWQRKTGEQSTRQELRSARREWMGPEYDETDEAVNAESLSRAVELDARRYDGQISRF